MKKLYFLFSLLMATVIGLSSCESDDSLTNEPPAQEYIDKAKEILVGDLVLSTRATMSGVDKTLLESGCPTKFNFSADIFINICFRCSTLSIKVFPKNWRNISSLGHLQFT